MGVLDRIMDRAEISRSTLTIAQYIEQAIASGFYGYTPPVVTYGPTGAVTERNANDFRTYVTQAYMQSPIVFGLMQRRASVFSEARFAWRAVKNGNPSDLLPTDEGLELLERPWPNGTTGELLTRLIQDVDLCGNAYLVRERDRLRRLRPDWTQIVLSGDPHTEARVDVMGYVYSPNGPDGGNYEAFLPDELVHWSPIPDPLASFRGMSWLTPVLRELLADQAATEHKLNFLRNGALLGPIVKAPPGISRDQFKAFIEAFESSHRGVSNSWAPVYLAGGSDVTLASASMQQIDMRGLTGSAETRLCVAAGVPAVIAGVSEGLQGSSLNAGNYNAAKRGWIDGGLRPLWRSVCSALSVITPPPDLTGLKGVDKDTRAELWINEGDIALLHEDRQDTATIQSAQATTINTLVTAGFVPESIVIAVRDNDLTALKHSGLTSVQLTPPGQGGEGDMGGQSDTSGGYGDQSGDQGGGQDQQGDQAYQQALEAYRQSAQRSRAPQIARAGAYGWAPALVALLSPDDADQEYGLPLDSVDFGDDGRIVAREYGVTVESDRGLDIAIHATPSLDEAERWADAIDGGEDLNEDHFSVEHHADGGAAVSFGELDEDLSNDDAQALAGALRDMAYTVDDQNPTGDAAPLLDRETQRSYSAALGRFRDVIDRAFWNPKLHPRFERGEHGGEFRKASDIVMGLLDAWDGKGRDPLKGLSRQDLRKAADELEIHVPEGASPSRLKAAIVEHHTRFYRGKPRAKDEPRYEDAVQRRVPRSGLRARGKAKAPEPRPSLASAKTVREVDTAAAAEAKRITGRDVHFDFGDSDVGVAREHAEGVLRALEAYPTAPLARVATADLTHANRHADEAGHTWAQAHRRDDGTYEIEFDQSWSSPQRAKDYREGLAASGAIRRMGRGHTAGTPMGVALHEMGHVIDLGSGEVWTGSLGRIAAPMVDEHLRDLGFHDHAVGTSLERRTAEAHRNITMGFEISRYAMENDRELAAEVFADVIHNGDDASELSRAIFDRFEGLREAR